MTRDYEYTGVESPEEVPDTLGIAAGHRDAKQLVYEFDQHFGYKVSSYSRSAQIKRGMHLHLMIDELLDDLDYEFDTEASKRHFVRQAIFDTARRESQADSDTPDTPAQF